MISNDRSYIEERRRERSAMTLDEMILPKELQMLKAFLPFLPVSMFLPPEEQTQIEQFAEMFENMDMYRDMFEGFSSAFTPGQKEDDT